MRGIHTPNTDTQTFLSFQLLFLSVMVVCSVYQRVLCGNPSNFQLKMYTPSKIRGRFYIFDDQLIQLINVSKRHCSLGPYNQCLLTFHRAQVGGTPRWSTGRPVPGGLRFLCERAPGLLAPPPRAIAMRPPGSMPLGSNTQQPP